MSIKNRAVHCNETELIPMLEFIDCTYWYQGDVKDGRHCNNLVVSRR